MRGHGWSEGSRLSTGNWDKVMVELGVWTRELSYCELLCSLPDPPSGISVSMEAASDTDPAVGLLQPLPRIEEVVTPYSSVTDQLSLGDLNARLQQMKSEITALPCTQENPSN